MSVELQNPPATKKRPTKDYARREELIQELYRVEGKAEIINGEIVKMGGTGFMPMIASFKTAMSLYDHQTLTRSGRAIADNCAFTVELPHRDSFSPDAAWYTGPSTGMKFLKGAPVFAVEVRSEGDYGKAAEREMAAKRADYFACGTNVVWDVDLLAPDVVVRKYSADAPDAPTEFRRGQTADAEPAVPGWTMAVDQLFE